MIFVLGHVIVSEITPPAQRGAMLRINNAIAILAGPLAPVVMGMVVDAGGNAVGGAEGEAPGHATLSAPV